MNLYQIEPKDSYADVWAKIIGQLNRLKSERSANKLMVVGTLSESKEPEIRTVVLRDIFFSPFSFLFFTDLRSPKVQELMAVPKVTTLLYDASLKRQLRCKTNASVVIDPNTLARYLEEYRVKEKDYSTQLAPSTQISSFESILKDDKAAFKNFGVIQLNVEQLEVLELGAENHFRVKFITTSDGKFSSASWLIP